MKKYYSVLTMLAMMVAALSFNACGGDDEEDGGGIPSPSSSMVIRINGVDWAASTENPPLFHGHFDGSNSAGLIFTNIMYTIFRTY